MSVLIKGMEMPMGEVTLKIYSDGRVIKTREKSGNIVFTDMSESVGTAVELPPHGDLIDRDAVIDEINSRIEAAVQWGVNAIADSDKEIKLRAEQAIATFCEASLTAKKMPVIIPAEREETND